jgi:hypothetical protein
LAIVVTLPALQGASAASDTDIDGAINSTAAYILKTVKAPSVGSTGGEWVVIGLARSGYSVPDGYFESYYKAVESYTRIRGGVLHDKKYTEYSRVVLALTAIGRDPRSVAGYNLVSPLLDYDKTVWQGVNGAIWALIALDSAGYGDDAIRDKYVSAVLDRQLADGGWNLADTEASDPDLTGMALQALAKYQDDAAVKSATDRALVFLSDAQGADGGYAYDSDSASESVIQVLVGLCELGIPLGDSRFTKNGKTPLDNMLSYKNADGSFRHSSAGGGNSQMSTEQALYGLAAAARARDGKSSLYRMGEGQLTVDSGQLTVGLPGRHGDVSVVQVTSPGKTFADVNGHLNQSAIEALAARGIINGKSASAFDPDATMTRAEFAAIVTRALGLPGDTVIAAPFADVAVSAWYASPVATAARYGIITGVGGGRFNPNGTITRQEAAVMTSRAAALTGIDVTLGETAVRDILAQFDDYTTVADWARTQLALCYFTGILDDDALEISPLAAIKRCEIAEMLFRLLEISDLLTVGG